MKFGSFKKNIYTLIIFSAIFSICSCSSSMDPYQPFVGDKEIEYSQKPDTVIALSGQGRVVLKLARPASPRAKKVGIFWSTGRDSLKVDFPIDKDTLQVSVNGLEREGTYSFDIYTYDENGEHRSIVTTKSVQVYGDIYANSIKSRLLAYLDIKADETIVHWGSNPEGAIGTVLKFTNKSNKSDSTLVPPDSSTVSISLSEDASTLTYYSLYQPGASIDTFRAPVKTSSIEGSSSFTIYDDEPHEGWDSGSFGGTKIDIKNTDHVFKGKYSAMVNYYDNDYGALTLSAPETLDLSNYSAIQVSVYVGPNIGSTIRIQFRSSSGRYTFEVNTETKNMWKTYTIPFSKMGNPTEMDEFVVQSDGDVGATAYIDEVKMF